jgi:hypothetical protein
VPDPSPIAPLIRKLWEADLEQRLTAALVIFTRGTRLAEAATQEWLKHPPLAKLMVRRPFRIPEITVGIAVHPSTFSRIRLAYQSPRLADVPPDQDAQEFELELPGCVRFDILTTSKPREAGAIARYLEKFGEGIQQVEIDVTDVDRATKILRTRFKLAPIYPATRAGAGGTRVNFFLAPIPDGKKVLIELVEKRRTSDRP